MKFSCDQCNAQYMIADEKVGTRGVKVKCKKCGHVIVVKPTAAASVQAGPAAEPRATDGFTSQTGGGFTSSPFNEPTQAMSASQLETLKAAAATSEASVARAAASLSASEQASAGGFSGAATVASAPSFSSAVSNGSAASFSAAATVASAPAFSPSPFANPFASPEPTRPDAERATLPPVSEPEPETPVPPAGGNGGFTGFGAPPAEFNLDQALGTAPASAPVPSARPAGEKEWYVAIDEAQIGPVDLREIEQRWDAKELSEDSLAWKAGMGDWSPLAEIPDFAYLVTERPQQQAPAASSYANMPAGATAMPSSSLPQAMGPMAFAGSNVEISGVSWKPSAASALSSLVQEELVAIAKPADEPVRTGTAPVDMGMPSFGAADLFGKGGNGGVGAPAVPAAGPAFAPPVGDPFGASQSWSVPKPAQSSGIKPMTVVLGGMGLVVVALIAVVVVILLRPPAPVAVVTPPPPVAVAVAANPAPSNPVAVEPKPVTPPKVAPVDDTPTPDVGTKKVKEKKKGSAKPEPGDKHPAGGKPDPVDNVFNEKPAAASNLAATPTKDEVVSGVKSNAKAIIPCLQAAKAKGELAAGKHTLVLDFVIKPNGSVSDGQLKGPNYVMGTSMPGCFAQKMKAWTFPASKNGIPVKNYPLAFGM